MKKLLTLIILAWLLAACDGESAPSAPDLGAQQTNLEAQLSSVKRAQTSTASANALRATVEAKSTRAAIDAANGQATREAKATAQTIAQATTTAQAYTFQLTATADALAMAQQHMAATVTADAQAIIISQQHLAATQTPQAIIANATATAEANHRAQIKADDDADFYNLIWRFGTIMFLLALFIVSLMFMQTVLDGRAARNKFIETRMGTVLIMPAGNGQYTARLLNAPSTPALLERDEFAASQAYTLDAEADILKVNTPRGTQYIAKANPHDAQTDANRTLALKLLRAAMSQVGGEAKRIPTAKDLGWRPETWVRAVSTLKPHVLTKEGRSGGTFCASEHPTLAQLYSAIGERRVRLTPPLPQLSMSQAA